MDAKKSFVDVRGVSVRYEVKRNLLQRLSGQQSASSPVLHDITLRLSSGDQIVLYGPPGAGKTSLLRLLGGGIVPTSGTVVVNGRRPSDTPSAAAGYVSSEEDERHQETVHAVLQQYADSHHLANTQERLAYATQELVLGPLLYRSAATLSETERLRVNMARAVISDAPVILLDNVAEDVGAAEVKRLLSTVFAGRTTIIATRLPATVEELELPLLLLHHGHLLHQGTCDEIASNIGCQRILDVWVEGIRYDLFRTLKRHTGVISVQLLPTSQFSGQKLRIIVRSGRYLPSVYDVLSQTSLVRVEEVPPSLHDIIARL